MNSVCVWIRGNVLAASMLTTLAPHVPLRTDCIFAISIAPTISGTTTAERAGPSVPFNAFLRCGMPTPCAKSEEATAGWVTRI